MKPNRLADLAPGLAFDFPRELCCGCGTTTGLALENVPVRIGGAIAALEPQAPRASFQMRLPTCATCRATLRRPDPKNPLHDVAAGFVGACGAAILAFSAIAPPVATGPVWMAAGACGIGFAGLSAWLRLRRGAPPVYVSGFRFAVTLGRDELRYLELTFANRAYRQRFRERNAAAIEAGWLAAC